MDDPKGQFCMYKVFLMFNFLSYFLIFWKIGGQPQLKSQVTLNLSLINWTLETSSLDEQHMSRDWKTWDGSQKNQNHLDTLTRPDSFVKTIIIVIVLFKLQNINDGNHNSYPLHFSSYIKKFLNHP